MNHCKDQVSDYVLGLLSSAEAARLERHARVCESCRAAVARERQLYSQIGATLAAVPEPTHARMMRLMPDPPTRRRAVSRSWQRAVTALALAVFLLIGGFGLRPIGTATVTASPSASLVAATATATTIAPTSTPTQLAHIVTITPEPVKGYLK